MEVWVYSFLYDPQELAGRAIQARVARHVLLKQLDALFPEGKGSVPSSAGSPSGPSAGSASGTDGVD